MAGGVYTFNPKLSQCVWGGKLAQQFAPDSFVKITRNEDMYNLVVGVDSLGTRTKTNNYSGRIEVTLQQGSPTNDDWNAIVTADEVADEGALPFYFKSGNFICTAVTAWCVKRPEAEFANTSGTRVWVLETDYLTITNGAG